MRILELRLLPTLAIGRLGAAKSPMDNYEAVVDPAHPLEHRQLVPAETFEVNTRTGEIMRAFVPTKVRFTEKKLVRPVAPFLEVWARTSASTLVPLTTALLRSNHVTPADVTWRVHVANLKLTRRTGEDNDRIEAQTGDITDHSRRELQGTCVNFWKGKYLPLGWVQYIKPTKNFPEIRLRFTPGKGLVYGSSRRRSGSRLRRDPNLADVLYNGRHANSWLGHSDRSGDPLTTVPSPIYAHTPSDRQNSRGYIDDECDGVVEVSLNVGGKTMSAQARIGAGPPHYAPDSFPVRTVADELEQALYGPVIARSEADPDKVEEIVRRAFETVRLMNTEVMNGNVEVKGQANLGSNMVAQDNLDTNRASDPIMAPALVDNLALLNLHQNVLAALRSGTAPWITDVLRNYDEVGDLTDVGRRKMPALMRGADGRYLALTRRQIDLIRKVGQGPIFSERQGPRKRKQISSKRGE
jgi:hypothetical protein